MFKRTISAALIFGAAAIAPPVLADQAQTSCDDRERVIATLQGKHGEVVTGVCLAGEAAVIELWSSPETGSWTLLMTRPDGRTCLMAAGQAWTAGAAKLVALGDPA
ncbi:MAG: hypothetical protein WD969_01045 [Paracoccaceae bacterium]